MKNKHAEKVPSFNDFFNPVIQALRDLGGRGSKDEIFARVIEIMGLTEEQVTYTYDSNDISIALSRAGFVLSWLKKGNIVRSGGKSIWILVDRNQEDIDVAKYKSEISKIHLQERKNKESSQDEGEDEGDMLDEEDQDAVLLKKIKQMPATAFEFFCKRLLEEIGLTNVERTGGSDDGGIDGTGILRLEGLVSLRVAYQAKRYDKGPVSSSVIRDFRGSLPCDVDKGVVITTSRFTPNAREEALNPEKGGVIDLIDGDGLVQKIKEYRMGVEVEDVKKIINIDDEYLKQFEDESV